MAMKNHTIISVEVPNEGSCRVMCYMGLDKIHRLTSYNNNKLRVDLEDFEGNTAYAKYNLFGVMSEKDKYKLILGSYSGRTVSFLIFRLRREELTDNQCVSEL